MAINQLRVLYVNRFEFSKRLPDKASIVTAELEARVFALRYIKSTGNLYCMPCCPSGIIPLFKLLCDF